MYQSLASLITLMLLLAHSLGMAAAPSSPFSPPVLPEIKSLLPRLSAPLNLDGDLKEWTSAVSMPVRGKAYMMGDPASFEKVKSGMEVLTAWNDDGICIAAIVADPNVISDPKMSPENQDCIEIQIDGRSGVRFLSTDFSPGAVLIFVRPPINGQPPVASLKEGSIAGMKVAGLKTPTGYNIEMLIPWSAFPAVKPQNGSQLGFQFVLETIEKPDSGKTLIYMQPDMTFTNGKARFVKFELASKADENESQNLLPQIMVEAPTLIRSSSKSDMIRVEAGKQLSAKIGSFQFNLVDCNGKTVLSERVPAAPMPKPWRDSVGVSIPYPKPPNGEGYYKMIVVPVDVNGKALGQVDRVANFLNVAKTLEQLKAALDQGEATTTAVGSAVQHSSYHGFPQYDFEMRGRPCTIVMPHVAAPGNPWLWRTKFWDHQPQTDIALLHKGYAVAFIDMEDVFWVMNTKMMDSFYGFLMKTGHFSSKPVIQGYSRGGLYCFNWGARHPDKVSSIYADAPVCDFREWMLGGHRLGNPKIWLSRTRAKQYRLNPVDSLKPMARKGVPILIVAGEADEVLPIGEHARLFEKNYRELDGPIFVMTKPFCMHHPHSLWNPAPIVDFILHNETGKALTPPAKAATPYGYEYFVVRDSLNNSRIRFEQAQKGRVAYLGASTKEADAWRKLVGEDLIRRFSKTQFDFSQTELRSIDAAPDVLSRTVLAHGPVDLMFVEATADDAGTTESAPGQMARIESIVRQARMANPEMDIVLLHFIDPLKLAQIRGGVMPAVIEGTEALAAAFGIPSIDLAQEVAERIHANEFTYEKVIENGQPSDLGCAVYSQSIKRLLDGAWAEPLAVGVKAVPYAMPEKTAEKKG